MILAGLLSMVGVAAADQRAAEDCLLAKVWDGYAEGYGVRSVTSTTLPKSGSRTYAILLYANNDYRFRTCGDRGVEDLDLILSTDRGEALRTDGAKGREPELRFRPRETATYLLTVRVAEGRPSDAGVALAVTYLKEEVKPESVAVR